MFLAALLTLLSAAPTQGGLRKGFEAAKASLVEVVGPLRSGTGIVVASDGSVVTSASFVALDRAQVRVGDQMAEGKVLAADGRLKLAVLRVEQAPFPLPSVAVRLQESPRRGEVLLGVARGKNGALSASMARVTKLPDEKSPFLETGHRLAPGSPLLDGKGRLVAMAVEQRAGRTRALPVLAIRRFLEESLALQRSAGASP